MIFETENPRLGVVRMLAVIEAVFMVTEFMVVTIRFVTLMAFDIYTFPVTERDAPPYD